MISERERGAVATAKVVFERLRMVLEEESATLSTHQLKSHDTFTERKNQLLRDLLVAQRECTSRAAQEMLAPQTRALKPLLSRNQMLLKAHIDAVKEVSAIIVDSIRQADSDGTYSRFD